MLFAVNLVFFILNLMFYMHFGHEAILIGAAASALGMVVAFLGDL